MKISILLTAFAFVFSVQLGQAHAATFNPSPSPAGGPAQNVVDKDGKPVPKSFPKGMTREKAEKDCKSHLTKKEEIQGCVDYVMSHIAK